MAGTQGSSGQMSPGEKFRMLESLDYVPGAIVSKVLAKSPGGTITLFAFDVGQGLSEHTAPFDAFVHVLDGEAELTIGGKPVRVAAGEAVIMPANVPHAVHAARPTKLLLVMIRSQVG